MDFLGVRSVSMASWSVAFTEADMDWKRSVVLPTRDARTESASFCETSAATFLDMSEFLKDARMGWRSSSVSTAPPVMFFMPRFRLLKIPPTRPDFSASAFPGGPSSSESEESDRASSSAMKSASSPEPRNSFCLARKSASSSRSPAAFLEKSRFFMALLLTLPYSHWRASFFFDAFSGAGSRASFSLSFFLGPPFALAAAAAAAPPSAPSLGAPSSSSSSSSLLLLELLLELPASFAAAALFVASDSRADRTPGSAL
mmetsp:Transcript_35921/g.103239  ORF Transcript_35921/g.103239 Transcript_35921/m.103239 type:complete len:258 (-) Transcript_35921:393-1166(-)